MGGFGRGVHPSYTPHWGCFGYCHGPLNPGNRPHWGCYGYCPGPINSRPYWGCYGYCNGPLWGGSPYWYPGIAVVPEYVPSNPSVIYQGNLNYTAAPPEAPATPPPAPSPQAKRKTVQEWIQQLSSPSAKLRGEAIEALAQYGPNAQEAVPALIKIFNDRDPHLRVEATLTLAKIGTAAVPGLIDGLRDGSANIQMGCCLTLGHLGKKAREAIDPLRQMTRAGSAAVRCHAAQAMWRIDRSLAPEVLPVLAKVLGTEDRAIQFGALTTLSQMGEQAQPAADAVAALLRSPDRQLQVAAAVCLANIAPSASNYLPALLAGLADQEVTVRRDAALALSHMNLSGAGADVAAALAKALRDDDLEVEHSASVALAHLGAPAVAPLVEALASEKASVRRYAILALDQMGKTAAPALPKLRALAQADPDEMTRVMAADAVTAIQP